MHFPRFRSAVVTFAVAAALLSPVVASAAPDPGGACSNPGSGVHVAPDGDDANPGTEARPVRTVQRGVDVAGGGGTVILHEGTYRESVVVRNGSRTLVARPGDTVWIAGSDIVTDWTSLNGDWATQNTRVPTSQDQRATFRSRLQIADRDIAGHLAIVAIDGTQLEQVSSIDQLDAGSFHVDGSGRVRLGTDPRGRTVEIAMRSVGLFLDNASGSEVSGIGFRHFATSPNAWAAMRIDADSDRVTVTESVFADNANTGLQILGTDATITANAFVDNGHVGANAHHADNLVFADNLVQGNNRERFAANASAGGLKVTASRWIEIRDNHFLENHSDAVWIDESVLGVDLVANHTENNDRYGFHIENSAKARLLSNLSEGDLRGIQFAESNDSRIYNNVVVGTEQAIAVLDAELDSANGQGDPRFGLTHDDRYGPVPDLISWNIDDVEVRNNVMVEGTDINKPLLFITDTVRERSAYDFDVRPDHNLFHRTNPSNPRWVVGFGDWPTGMIAATSVSQWQSRTGLGQGDAETSGTFTALDADFTARNGGPADGTGATVPQWLADIAGIGGGFNDRGLFAPMNANPGPDCGGNGGGGGGGNDGPDTTAPSAPTGVSANTAGEGVLLSWTAGVDDRGVAGHLVHRDGSYVAWVSSGTTYRDTDATPGSSHRYEIRSQDAARNNSAPTAITVDVPGDGGGEPPVGDKPAAPVSVAATSAGDSVTLTWAPGDNTQLKGWLIHRNWQYLAFVPANARSFTDDGLAVGSTVGYQVRAQWPDGSFSDPSTRVQVTVGDGGGGGGADVQAPTPPPNVTAASAAGQVALSWSAGTDDRGVGGYLVHRNGSYLAWVPNGRVYVDATAQPGVTYTYAIRTQDTSKNNSTPTTATVIAR